MKYKYNLYGLSGAIKEARKAQGFSQNKLCEKAGIANNSLSLYENRGVIPSVISLCALAETLNVSVAQLLGEEKIGANACKWIPTDERQPEGETVLATCKNMQTDETCVIYASMIDGCWFDEVTGEYCNNENEWQVVAWQPLPASYSCSHEIDNYEV